MGVIRQRSHRGTDGADPLRDFSHGTADARPFPRGGKKWGGGPILPSTAFQAARGEAFAIHGRSSSSASAVVITSTGSSFVISACSGCGSHTSFPAILPQSSKC